MCDLVQASFQIKEPSVFAAVSKSGFRNLNGFISFLSSRYDFQPARRISVDIYSVFERIDFIPLESKQRGLCPIWLEMEMTCLTAIADNLWKEEILFS